MGSEGLCEMPFAVKLCMQTILFRDILTGAWLLDSLK